MVPNREESGGEIVQSKGANLSVSQEGTGTLFARCCPPCSLARIRKPHRSDGGLVVRVGPRWRVPERTFPLRSVSRMEL
jgi:hypothetical protein